MTTALARAPVLALLRRVEDGLLRIVDGPRTYVFGDPDSALRATVTLHDRDVWRALLRGSTGLGESYRDGRWDADDVTALIRIAARNAPKLDALRHRLAPVLRPVQLARRARANTPGRSRRQIAAHYDLGNDLFAAMLDERMMYSCGVFADAATSLEDAQLAKIDAIIDKLDLHADDHLLEIGSGWGGLAIRAAQRSGCRVTTTTLSAEQHRLATERVRAAGLEERITVLLQDYRELRGTYDKLASIEMIEAVGWRDFDTYFARVSALLVPDGIALVQAIVIDDRAYEVEKAGTSFITTFIFPGGTLPSVEVIARAVRRTRDLRWLAFEDLTPHYVLTLQHWRRRFLAAADDLDPRRYDAGFRRIWELYLRYCEAGFAERRIGVAQIVLAKPGHRPSGRVRRAGLTAAASAGRSAR